MLSFDSSRLAIPLAVAVVILFAGCSHTPSEIAYRQRVESGFETPEEVVRFKVSDMDRQRAVASAQDYLPQIANAIELDFIRAASRGDVSAVKLMLSGGIRINASDAYGNSALLEASGNGHLDVVRALLAAGAHVDGMDASLTPLSSATIHNQLQIVQLLLRKGARIDTTGKDGTPAVLRAVQLNRVDVCRELLLAGANTRTRDANGSSLLHIAVLAGYRDMVALLLEFGANPNVADADGLSPLYWAERNPQSDITSMLIKAGAIDSLKAVVSRRSHQYFFGEF
jgi:ankyrin repeat protein